MLGLLNVLSRIRVRAEKIHEMVNMSQNVQLSSNSPADYDDVCRV